MLSRFAFAYFYLHLIFPSDFYGNSLQSFETKKVLEIINKGGVKGLAHITGGGFTECIPKVFPTGLGAKIITGSWEVPPVFKWLQQVRVVNPQACLLLFQHLPTPDNLPPCSRSL
jgi:hypothetical protein